MKTATYLILAASLLAGCGEPSQPPAPKTKLFEPQRDALDKAKGVQQTVNEQAEQQKQSADDQTQ